MKTYNFFNNIISGSNKTESKTKFALLEQNKEKAERLWKVILYNSDHFFEEVEFQLQKATGCSLEVAHHIAMQTHISGKAVAFVGEKHKCNLVKAILQEIHLIVTLEQD